MPTYEYECKKCGNSFDAFQSMSDDPLVKCPSCSKNGLRRLIGGGLGIIFKGSGFYVTDSRSDGNGGSEGSKDSSESGGNSPVETKSKSSKSDATSADSKSSDSNSSKTASGSQSGE